MKTLEVLQKVLRGKRVKPATQRHYREALSSLAKYEEEWPSNGIVINEWLASLKGYSDSTIKMWFDFVNSAGKYMKKAYKVKNPCESADRPKVSKKRRRYFTADEIVKIIKACRFEQDKALILTLIDSTCRIGELVGLIGRNVGEGWLNLKGKTGERRYRLDPIICKKLKEMAGGDDKPVFKSRFGGAASVDALQHRVRRVVNEAGITGTKIGPHTLRHSGASFVAQETGSALAVKALLQHDNIDTSMEYIHDAEDVIQQRISPLRLVGERIFETGGKGIELKPEQLVMGEEVSSKALVPVSDEVIEGIIDLTDEMFEEIGDGVAIRPLLKSDDLRLIRKAFIGYVSSGYTGYDEAKLRALMKRMLRRVR